MRYRGVHYDTGVRFIPSRLSREVFDPDVVRYEIQAIAQDLSCNAVRIVGDDLERIAFASRVALEAGLAVFFNPWLIGRGEAELLPYLAEGARIAERLRGEGEVVFVTGCELSLFAHGLIPGDGVYDRVGWLLALRTGETPSVPVTVVRDRTRSLLRKTVDVVRRGFGGPVTYAAGVWEEVDWEPFDIVGVDYYRAEQTDEEYAEGLRELGAHGKPVAVLEFGCCTYEGADRRGGMGWMDLDEWSEDGPRWVAGPRPRSEATQARYLVDQLEIFQATGVDSAFVFTLVAPYLPHDPDDPVKDFDLCSYALVKTLDPADPQAGRVPPWRPKESFHALANCYRALAGDGR
ncbi:hypothetical protein [Actinoallomurus acaciae]|uniref:Abortive infection protein n=1 Tax=Actinoallomurus acaciae TaxID=502577 RepID=A0ABV5Y9H9_9ACTN